MTRTRVKEFGTGFGRIGALASGMGVACPDQPLRTKRPVTASVGLAEIGAA
ncbi:MAG: hypothetical protein JWR80_2910 [Bradyrhizobium sp.]|nr:hypothetical protein [Bradyrhizobium sp.]